MPQKWVGCSQYTLNTQHSPFHVTSFPHQLDTNYKAALQHFINPFIPATPPHDSRHVEQTTKCLYSGQTTRPAVVAVLLPSTQIRYEYNQAAGVTSTGTCLGSNMQRPIHSRHGLSNSNSEPVLQTIHLSTCVYNEEFVKLQRSFNRNKYNLIRMRILEQTTRFKQYTLLYDLDTSMTTS